MPFTYYTILPEWWVTSINGVVPAAGFPFTYYSYGNYPPSNLLLPFPFYWNGQLYENITLTWSQFGSTPTNTGWWLEVANDYTGAALISNQGTPRDPRSFDEMSPFTSTAAGTGMMGGFPGVASVWNNFLIYAKGGYTVGTNIPPLQIYDGQFDEQVGLLPPTSSSGIPNAIVTTLVADGQIFLASFDAGTSKTTWVGRVFSFDVETETFTQLGTPFNTGELPYALAWHNGRLWCGTHRQDPTVQGAIYFFRPNIDTAWTSDVTLTTGSCCSLLSFNGTLYAGTTAPAGTAATVLVRSTAGAWSTSLTGPGTAANNAFLALATYGTNMYASYWDSAAPTSLIKKFNGTSWSTAYTGTGDTNIPFVAFPTDDGNIIAAIGGGLTYAGALVTSPDGTTWTDETVFLTQGATNATGIPAFGIITH